MWAGLLSELGGVPYSLTCMPHYPFLEQFCICIVLKKQSSPFSDMVFQGYLYNTVPCSGRGPVQSGRGHALSVLSSALKLNSRHCKSYRNEIVAKGRQFSRIGSKSICPN